MASHTELHLRCNSLDILKCISPAMPQCLVSSPDIKCNNPNIHHLCMVNSQDILRCSNLATHLCNNLATHQCNNLATNRCNNNHQWVAIHNSRLRVIHHNNTIDDCMNIASILFAK